MGWRYQKHYTVDEARALLPEIRQSLNRLNLLRKQIARYDEQSGPMLQQGEDLGGSRVNSWIGNFSEFKQLMAGFAEREIQIKDLERGLIDFPAIVGGREVFLCWEQDDEDIEFWHDLDSGYVGRERL